MIAREPRHRPRPWNEQKSALKHPWLVLLLAIEWPCQWIAFLLGKWSFLEVLEYLGSFSVLVAVIFYFSESGDRIKQKHYQAWQVVNTAQGKGGSGGRIEALQELNADEVPLVAVDVSGAFLQGISLKHGRLRRSNFSTADVRNSDFHSAELTDADLGSANFRGSNMREAQLQGAKLDDADFFGADLTGADLSDASIADTDLRNADLNGIVWQRIRSIRGANVFGVKNAPPGFVKWATQQGAVQFESDSQWTAWQNAH
jgi:Pentapeptide repeats (8 copies)